MSYASLLCDVYKLLYIRSQISFVVKYCSFIGFNQHVLQGKHITILNIQTPLKTAKCKVTSAIINNAGTL